MGARFSKYRLVSGAVVPASLFALQESSKSSLGDVVFFMLIASPFPPTIMPETYARS